MMDCLNTMGLDDATYFQATAKTSSMYPQTLFQTSRRNIIRHGDWYFQTLTASHVRISRGFVYAFIRAGASVILREFNTKTLIWDMMDGELDIIYATYLGYDEIAHHSGIRDRDSFRYLKKLDKHFSRIEHAASYSKRKYEFVILSDHGQSNGATFKQRNDGVGLDALVSALLPEDMDVFGDFDPDNTNMKRAYVPFSQQTI